MNDENSTSILTDRASDKMTIEFQSSSDLLKEGIIPFPIKKVEIQMSDPEYVNSVLTFYENLIREFWCKGKLKT